MFSIQRKKNAYHQIIDLPQEEKGTNEKHILRHKKI
jgi:hypothetical protein